MGVVYLKNCITFVIQTNTQKHRAMKSQDLVKSFLDTANWSNFKDGANRPIRGTKWITRKQSNFLHELFCRDFPELHYDGHMFFVGDYNVKVGRIAPNGCRCLSIELSNEIPIEE